MSDLNQSVLRVDPAAKTLYFQSNCLAGGKEAFDGITVKFLEKNAVFHLGVLALVLREYRDEEKPAFVRLIQLNDKILLLAKAGLLINGSEIMGPYATIKTRWYEGRGLDLQTNASWYEVSVGGITKDEAPHLIVDVFRSLVRVGGTPNTRTFRMMLNLEKCGARLKIETPGLDSLLRRLSKIKKSRTDQSDGKRQEEGKNTAFNVDLYRKNLKADLEDQVAYYSHGTLEMKNIYRIRFEKKDPRSCQRENRNDTVSLENLLKATEDRVLTIAGKPGAGKTTALRYLAWNACADRNILPIYIQCTPDLFSAVANKFKEHFNGNVDQDVVQGEIERNRCLFFLDGYDDMNETDQKIFQARFEDEYRYLLKTCRFVISTRNTVIPELRNQTVFTTCEPDSAEDCLQSNGIAPMLAKQIVDNLKIMKADEIVSTPMFIWFVVLMLKKDKIHNIPNVPGALIKKVVEIYFLEEMFRKRRMTDFKLFKGDKCHVIGGLGLLAYKMIEKQTHFDGEQVVTIFREYFRGQKYPLEMANRLFDGMTHQHFLEENPDGMFKFWHDVFRDYFAARHIEKQWANNETECAARELMERFRWDIPLQLLCGFASQEIQEECVKVAVTDANVSLGIKLFRSASGVDKEGVICDYILKQLSPLCSDGDENAAMAAYWLCMMQSQRAASILLQVLDAAIDRAGKFSSPYLSRQVDCIRFMLNLAERMPKEYPERKNIETRKVNLREIEKRLRRQWESDSSWKRPRRILKQDRCMDYSHRDGAFGGLTVEKSHYYGYIPDNEVLSQAIIIMSQTICRWKNIAAKYPIIIGHPKRITEILCDRDMSSGTSDVEPVEDIDIKAHLMRAEDLLKKNSLHGISNVMSKLGWIIHVFASNVPETETREMLEELMKCGRACSTQMAKIWMISAALRVQQACKRRFIGTVSSFFDAEALDFCAL